VVVRRFVFKPRWILGHLMVVAAALTCIRLADWQLSRAHVTEALQNWGYAFQWPLFSVFFLIGWWRMLRLESIRLDEMEAAENGSDDAAVSNAADDGTAGAADAPVSRAEVRRQARERPPLTAPILAPASQAPPTTVSKQTEPTDGVRTGSGLADPEDEQLAAYNRMLAKLASQDAARDEAGRR
jgi:hypothetical protein